MNPFDYEASDRTGKVLRGSLWAREVRDARQELLLRGLIPVRVTHGSGRGTRSVGTRARRLTILRSLAVHLSAGVPVRRALAATERLSLGAEINAAIRDTRRLVSEGESLATALERAGLVGASTGAIVRTGEKSGDLGRAVELAAGHLEYEVAVIARTRAAMTYPAFLLVTACVSFGVIGFVVLPRFAEVVQDVGASPPPLTQVILRLAQVLRDNVALVTLGIAVAAALTGLALYRPRSRERLIQAVLRAPVLRGISASWTGALIARSLGTMLCTGIPANRALEIAAQGAPSAVARARIRWAHELVAGGHPFSRSLATAGVVPERVTPLLEVGEKTSQLGEMLTRVALELERDATDRFERVLALLQPTIVLIFGGLIAVTAALVLQTLYSVRPVL
ncbi:MAG: type II secretion system F family protein [Gemmatimonadaceae bacterium]